MTSSNSNIYESFEAADIYGVNYNAAQVKLACPKCQDERKNHKTDKPLSVNPAEGTWLCHHCGWKGGLKNHDYRPIIEKEYKYPQSFEPSVSAFWDKWFKNRGIEKHVLDYFAIGEFDYKGVKWVKFPYKRESALINAKSRSENKDFRLSPGAELIFFNLDAIKQKKECVITEGEIDAMSLHQSNVFNAVSVPNGASKGSMKLEYFDNCFGYFTPIEKVILFTDNDEPGIALRDELARRIGKDKCWIIRYPEGCKDANEVLIKHGSNFLKELVENAEPYPVEDISKPSDYLARVLEYKRNGFPVGDKIGYSEFDKLLSFRPGELTIISGIPNSGKSNALDQILIRLSSRCGWRHGVLSREQFPHDIHVTKLTQIFAGKALHQEDLSEDAIRKTNKFLDHHFFLFGITDLTIEGIIAKARMLVMKYGIKSLVVDPWNTLTHDKTNSDSETDYINEVLQKFVAFKDMYTCHVFLVAHPKKMQTEIVDGKKRIAMPNLYDIAGSNNFFNVMDNGLIIYRNLGTRGGKKHPLGDTVTWSVQKVRTWFIGMQGTVNFDYNYTAGTYAEEMTDFESEHDYWLYKTRQVSEPPKSMFVDRELPQLTDISKLPIKTSFDEPSEVEKDFKASFEYNEDGSLKPNPNIDPGF